MTVRDRIDDRRTRSFVRLALALLVVANGAVVGAAYLDRHDSVQGPTATTAVGDTVAGERDGSTVVTTQGLIPTVEAPRAAISGPNGGLYAIGPSGEMIYRNTTYHSYWDVDPVPGTNASVLYVAGEFVPAGECGTGSPCYVRRVQIANLTTGAVREIYADTAPQGRWHDVDRYDDDRILVAGISEDRAAIINVTSGLVEWSWEAETDFPPSSGGDFDGDWTHVNDVEVTPDGRIMVDLRNQDAVVFVDPETGLQEEWTLGADDAHDVLDEQHNPDYIPAARGGPAVVVADSRNDRIVEYQRADGRWERSWVWQDARTNWPRDADRLPNGHTLITDSGADRVVEIDADGDVVWRVTADNPYEAERLGTGDESRGGESATRLGLASRTVDGGDADAERTMLASALDAVGNALSFVAPVWMDTRHLAAALAVLGALLIWPPLEVYWSDYRLRVRRPVLLDRD